MVEQIMPEGFTAPRRKSAVTDETLGEAVPGRAPVISRIPPLTPAADGPYFETARPRPAGTKSPEALHDLRHQREPREKSVDEPKAADAGDPRLGFVVDTRWNEAPGPASLPATPPAWFTQLTRWQWNSTLLAISLVLVSGIFMTAWRRDAATPPAQFAMPEIHYHVESPRQQRAEPALSVSATRHDVQDASMPEFAESDRPTAVAWTTETEPTNSRPDEGPAIRTVRADSPSASHFELMEYPETDYPDYSVSSTRNRPDVRLDGQIQEYK